MVLFGQVGRELVGLINAHGPYAVGISGEDAHLFTATRRTVEVEGSRPTSVSSATSHGQPRRGARPDRGGPHPGGVHHRPRLDGVVHNINADTAAAALAEAHRRREAGGAHRRRGAVHELAGPRRRWPPRSTSTRSRNCCPASTPAWCPKMEACLRAVHGGVPTAHVDRRPRRAFGAARTVHRRGHRHDGHARRRTLTYRADAASEGHGTMPAELLQQRWSSALMNTYGVPRVALVARPGRGASPTPTASSTWTCSPASPSTSSGTRTRRSSRPSRRSSSTLGHVSNLYASRAGDRAGRAAARRHLGGTPRPGVPVQLRHRGQRGGVQARPATGRPKIIAARERVPRPDHGCARAHRPARQARRRSSRCPPGVEHVPVRRPRRTRRARSTPTPPRCSWSRSWVRAASSFRRRDTSRGPADHRRSRRAARARRSADRDRAHGLVLRPPGGRDRARRDDPREGSRRRHADRRRASRPARPRTCSGRASTARRSAATRSARAARARRAADDRRATT